MTRLLHNVPFALALAAGLISSPAAAKRPYAPALTCQALKGGVDRAGAVVISTGRNTYDRFVSDSRFCERTQVTEPAWIDAADGPDCFVGYTCKEYSRDDW